MVGLERDLIKQVTFTRDILACLHNQSHLSELSQLANDLWDYKGATTGPQVSRLPHAVAAFVDNASQHL